MAIAVPNARDELLTAQQVKPNFEHGAELFEVCAACHGADGAGTSDGTVPAIAGQHFRVVLKQLVDYRHDQRWDIRMEHFTDRHRLAGPQEVADIAALYRRAPPHSRQGIW